MYAWGVGERHCEAGDGVNVEGPQQRLPCSRSTCQRVRRVANSPLLRQVVLRAFFDSTRTEKISSRFWKAEVTFKSSKQVFSRRGQLQTRVLSPRTDCRSLGKKGDDRRGPCHQRHISRAVFCWRLSGSYLPGRFPKWVAHACLGGPWRPPRSHTFALSHAYDRTYPCASHQNSGRGPRATHVHHREDHDPVNEKPQARKIKEGWNRVCARGFEPAT